jgi:hypothetical protein
LEFNIESIASLAGRAYLANARKAFGEDGADGIKRLLDAVRSIYQRCPPERIQGTLTVVNGIKSSPLDPVISSLGTLASIQDHAGVGSALFGSPHGGHDVVEVCADGTFRHLHVTIDIDLFGLSQKAIVYRWDRGVDRIVAKTFDDIVPKVSPMLKSMFAAPTLASLELALERYAKEMVFETQCRILAKAWEGGVDGPRLVLVNKPESLMRDSLAQALMLLTRDTSVRPEQNTDETKPVDIRVEWFGSGASALIEVKWLGKSTAIPRTPSPVPTYTEYRAPRAQEGADQLADYMDRQARHSNATAPRGYLVVFDARRRNVKGPKDQLKREDALHFAAEDIVYNPDHSKNRRDFAVPYRFFMKPRESWFAAA